jgi:hypothetical protein
MTQQEKDLLKQAIEIEVTGSFIPGLKFGLETVLKNFDEALDFGKAMSNFYNRPVGVNYNDDVIPKLCEALLHNLKLRVDLIDNNKQNGFTQNSVGHTIAQKERNTSNL